MSAGTIDLILAFVLLFFTAKGFATGAIRSVISIAAVVLAWWLSGAAPNLMAPLVGRMVDAHSVEFPLVVRIVTWIGAFLVVQTLGFLITGLVEKIGLGGANKLAGAVLGFATGVLVGCLPLVVVLAVPAIAHAAPVQQVLRHSFFLRTYTPLVRSFVHPARGGEAASSAPHGRPHGR